MRGGIIRRGGMMGCLWMFIRRWWGRCVGRGGGGFWRKRGFWRRERKWGNCAIVKGGGRGLRKRYLIRRLLVI